MAEPRQRPLYSSLAEVPAANPRPNAILNSPLDVPPAAAVALDRLPRNCRGGHTGEEVIAAATGPEAERVSGFVPNTRLFRMMLAAWGWLQYPPNP